MLKSIKRKTAIKYLIALFMVSTLLFGCRNVMKANANEEAVQVEMTEINTSVTSGVYNVIYPNVNGESENALGYAILELALEKSGEKYVLNISNEEMNNDRIRYNLSEGKVSVSDFGTSAEYEEEFLAIPIPIDKGLNGWRVPVVRVEDAKIFSEVKNIEDLKIFIAGQGTGWPDTDILREAGLEVAESPNIDTLFAMLEEERYDYLPLGANEAWALIEQYSDVEKLVIENDLVIVYPFARFFFVNKENTELYDVIYRGLLNAIEDGSFDEVFYSHPSNAWLMEEDLLDRQVIRIENSYMGNLIETIPEEYFYSK